MTGGGLFRAKENPVKYIAIGILAAAAFLVGAALIGMLLNPEKTFADGFVTVLDWILAVIFGASCAGSVWKKDDKDSGRKE